MPQVVIIGNSGAARECYWLLDDMVRAAPGLKNYYMFKGFLVWNGYRGDLKKLAHFLLGDAREYVPSPDDLFVIGIGQPYLRKAAYEDFKARGADFLTLVHPWSEISPEAEVGEANIFQRGSTVHCDTCIGNANYFNGAINVGHDVEIGDYNFIGPASLLLGECSIGSQNMLGVRCTLLPKACVGNGNILAPGSIVYKGCKDNCRLAGNPALNIGDI